MRHIHNFLQDQNGATAIEYGLIAAMIGVVIIGISNSQYGFGLKTGFTQIEDSFTNYASF